ncbi:MAG: glycosyl transferase family 1 [Desulfobacterium sp.]|nr:glycosyl transferase family 1 [Desulfobacterium sp.]
MNNFFIKILKRLTRSFGYEISRYSQPSFSDRMVSLKPHNGYKGNVLLAYILDPFLLKPGEAVSTKHTHDWESLQIGKTFQELGYAVDVIDFRNSQFIPQKKYSFFVSARSHFQQIGQRLNPDCIKIVHLETSHFLFNNTSAYKRNLDLQQRRGVTLTSLKWIQPNWAIEHADIATIKGNQFTVDTYAYAKKPFFQTRNPAVVSLPWPDNKKFDECRNNYMWLGSDGLVHKGLDLVLEAFAGMPDHHLTVCGPVQQDKRFEKAYYEELYETPNIHTYGWLDVGSEAFIDLSGKCIGLVYPSCAEAQAGAVINCLQAGLIPVISYESGVDVDDFGVILRDCSILEIQETVQKVSAYPEEKLKVMARTAWEYASNNHTRERFAEEYKQIIQTILEQYASRADIMN